MPGMRTLRLELALAWRCARYKFHNNNNNPDGWKSDFQRCSYWDSLWHVVKQLRVLLFQNSALLKEAGTLEPPFCWLAHPVVHGMVTFDDIR